MLLTNLAQDSFLKEYALGSKILDIYLFIYLFNNLQNSLNAPRVVKVHHEEHQANEPLARLL